ncbi:MAG: hypothetical protein ACK4N5_01090, partial [Myxococcales bacterium]
GARRLLDERELWPDGRFTTAHLVATVDVIAQQRPLVEAFVRAHAEETDYLQANPGPGQRVFDEQLKKLLTKGLKPELLQQAWPRVDFTLDPLRETVRTLAEDTRALGMLREIELDPLYDGTLLPRPGPGPGLGRADPK